MRIGLFDSGVGGITVLKEALKLLPDEDFLYYADTRNVPYGTKSKEQVSRCICESVDFMAGRGIKALVVACNTATSIAISDLRKKYDFPILGMEPAVKPAVERHQDLRVLVAATPLTLKEEKYQNLVSKVDSNGIVDSIPLPELVGFAEKFIFDENVILTYLREKLSCYRIEEYGTVVLGCTHFPFFRGAFKKLFSENTDIIDGSVGTVKHLKKVLEERNLYTGNGSGNVVFYSSQVREPGSSRYEKYLRLLD
jgi:glutamate racemase